MAPARQKNASSYMLSKKKRAYDPAALPPERRLRANLGDLLARNELPATRIAELASDVNRVQPTALRNLAGRADGNSARKLKRNFLKPLRVVGEKW